MWMRARRAESAGGSGQREGLTHRQQEIIQLIARGATADQAVAEIGMVVEGLTTAPVLRDVSRRLGIELPITEGVCAVLRAPPSRLSSSHEPGADDRMSVPGTSTPSFTSPPRQPETVDAPPDPRRRRGALQPARRVRGRSTTRATIAEARQEVARHLAGGRVEHSRLRIADGAPVSACLVSLRGERGCPIVSYVLTAPAWKRRGLATDLLGRSLASLAAAGHTELRAVITEGNLPSEAVFGRAGFRRV
jgi:RimJ/RimL family protein N-acetyltransferase